MPGKEQRPKIPTNGSRGTVFLQILVSICAYLMENQDQGTKIRSSFTDFNPRSCNSAKQQNLDHLYLGGLQPTQFTEGMSTDAITARE